jgi:hypothetical protein
MTASATRTRMSLIEHPDDDTVESYAMARISDSIVAAEMALHFNNCNECGERLREISDFNRAMRGALEDFEEDD